MDEKLCYLRDCFLCEKKKFKKTRRKKQRKSYNIFFLN